jgi:hypothetical protein
MRQLVRANLVGLCAWLWVASAAADGRGEARALFERGSELYAQRKFPEAIAAFVASHRLSPNANLAFNIAQTYALAGRLEDAFNWYETHRSGALDEPARKRVEQRQLELAAKVAIIEVVTDPAGATLWIDDPESESVGAAPRRIALAGGTHEIFARREGHQPARASVDAQVGQTRALSLALRALPSQLSISSRPSAARVYREPGRELVGETPLALTVSPGTVSLTLQLDGYLQLLVSREIRAGVDQSLHLELQPQPPPQPTTLPIAQPQRQARAALVPARPRTRGGGLGDFRWLGYGLAGGALIAGAGLGVAALDQKGDAQADPSAGQKRELDRLNLAADLTIGGAVLIALTTLIADRLLMDPSADGDGEARASE